LKKGSDLKNFFNFVNRKLNTKSFVPDLEVVGQSLINNAEKAKAFNRFFGSVFTKDNEISPPFNNLSAENLPNCTVTLSPDLVLSCLNRIEPSLAAGPDKLNAFFLKKLKYSIAQPLSSIFEVSYRTGILPELWKKGIVIPIFKKD